VQNLNLICTSLPNFIHKVIKKLDRCICLSHSSLPYSQGLFRKFNVTLFELSPPLLPLSICKTF
jgi:hypothetical protein